MRPRCHECGYDLSGSKGTEIAKCPECGTPIDWPAGWRVPGPLESRAAQIQLAAMLAVWLFLAWCFFSGFRLPGAEVNPTWKTDGQAGLAIITASPLLIPAIWTTSAFVLWRVRAGGSGGRTWLAMLAAAVVSVFFGMWYLKFVAI